MIIEPKLMGNVCLTAHPKGCEIEVEQQINYIKAQPALKQVKNALIIGCSAGYGLATRIALAYGCQTTTLGLSFERVGTETKVGSVGYYNNKAFSNACIRDGKTEVTLNVDAFSPAGKEETLKAAKQLFGDKKIDLVIYSLASPVRTDPVTGISYKSVLKPIGQPYKGKTVDIFKGTIKEVVVEPATPDEVVATVKVMGGEDWQLWVKALMDANLLASNAVTVAYSYIGPAITAAIYREGSIGKAKEHLEQSAITITNQMHSIQGKAYVSVNKAVVTRASSVIPVVPLYMALLFKIMKEQGTHEDCIQQEYRMLQQLYNQSTVPTDNEGRLRLDDYEMAETVQDKIEQQWSGITEESLKQLGDLEGVRKAFMQTHGFEVDGVNYQEDISGI